MFMFLSTGVHRVLNTLSLSDSYFFPKGYNINPHSVLFIITTKLNTNLLSKDRCHGK